MVLFEGLFERKEPENRDPGVIFMRPEVQNLLKKVTGYDVNKVFKVRFQEIEAPSYKLVTEDELKEVSCLLGAKFNVLLCR